MSYTGRIKRGPIAADVLGQQFTTVFNHAIRDKRLSRRARGLLVEILSHRDGYGISLPALMKAGPEGRDAIRAALTELEEHGYLHRSQERDPATGRLGEAVYEITDMPEGMTLEAGAPWSQTGKEGAEGAPEPETPSEKKPRSGPSSGFPTTGPENQKPRSGPSSGFPTSGEPTSGEPTSANPPHKKTSPSEDQSLSPGTPSPTVTAVTETPGPDERESPAAPQNDTGAPASDEHEDVRVVEAWMQTRQAAGHSVPSRARSRLLRDAGRLLAEGEDVEHLVAAAADMGRRADWYDLARHLEHFVPKAAAVPGQRGELPAWCGECNLGEEPTQVGHRLREDSEGRLLKCPACHPAARALAA